MSNETPTFPNGKPHVSFSEIKQWKECPFRHKLAYIDKIDTFKPSPYLHFGTAVHEGCETLLSSPDGISMNRLERGKLGLIICGMRS